MSGAAQEDTAGVKLPPPPVVYIAGFGLGLALDASLPSVSLSRALAWSLGGLLLVAGFCLAAAFFSAFRQARTPVDLRKPTSTIVTSGPYRLSRNPGYLSLALTYAGTAVVASTLWAFVTLVPTLLVINYGVIRREERYLERKFGAEYTSYKERTRRWL